MKEIFESWLGQISGEVGLLACGVRLPDGSFLTQSFSYDFPADQWDVVWKKLDETAHTFSLRHLPVARQCWKFERHHLYWAMRPDGLAFGLLATQDALQVNGDYIQSLFEEFMVWDAQAAA